MGENRLNKCNKLKQINFECLTEEKHLMVTNFSVYSIFVVILMWLIIEHF